MLTMTALAAKTTPLIGTALPPVLGGLLIGMNNSRPFSYRKKTVGVWSSGEDIANVFWNATDQERKLGLKPGSFVLALGKSLERS